DHTAQTTLTLGIPDDLPPGDYTLQNVLYNPASGERLEFNAPEGGAAMEFRLTIGEKPGHGVGRAGHNPSGSEGFSVAPWNAPAEGGAKSLAADSLVVRDVTPASGAVISGTSPVEFVATIDYTLASVPEALLDVR